MFLNYYWYLLGNQDNFLTGIHWNNMNNQGIGNCIVRKGTNNQTRFRNNRDFSYPD